MNNEAAQHSMHPTGGSLRVFWQLSWLEIGSGKIALSRPTHQRVTPAVGRLSKFIGRKQSDSRRPFGKLSDRRSRLAAKTFEKVR